MHCWPAAVALQLFWFAMLKGLKSAVQAVLCALPHRLRLPFFLYLSLVQVAQHK